MSTFKYIGVDDLLYSCIYGNGIYKFTGEFVQDPLCGDAGTDQCSPLVKNIMTGEQFFLKRFNCDREMRNIYRDKILNPPDREHILWPSDMIEFNDELLNCSLFVSQEYTENETPLEEKTGNMALLFPYGGYPNMINGIRRRSSIHPKNWRNPEIRKMIIEILRAFESLNRNGYIYEDIHLTRMFFTQDDKVYLNFSNLIYSFKDCYENKINRMDKTNSSEYPLEFADPALVRNIENSFTFNSQNYSLCALIFYLLVKRYPYDGRLLTGYVDDSVQKHYVKFRDYHKMPVFVFDPDDNQNALGAFAEEEAVIELWEDLPDILKVLFQETLSKDNAERKTGKINPTPSMWLKIFEDLGWMQNDEEVLK